MHRQHPHPLPKDGYPVRPRCFDHSRAHTAQQGTNRSLKLTGFPARCDQHQMFEHLPLRAQVSNASPEPCLRPFLYNPKTDLTRLSCLCFFPSPPSRDGRVSKPHRSIAPQTKPHPSVPATDTRLALPTEEAKTFDRSPFELRALHLQQSLPLSAPTLCSFYCCWLGPDRWEPLFLCNKTSHCGLCGCGRKVRGTSPCGTPVPQSGGE